MSIPLTESDYPSVVAEAADQGQLRIQYCTHCEKWIWFPRVVCPYCFERSLEWRIASGEGTIVTASIVYRQHQEAFEPFLPIVLALVHLDEGCEMVSSIIGGSRSDVQIGDKVRVTGNERWSSLPQFELVLPA